MEGILNKEMKSIVEKEVTYYKDDLNMDFDIMRGNYKDIKKVVSYIWFTRQSGTVIMREDFLKVLNSNENVSFKHWAKSIISCYRLKVDKACKVNIYGTIEKIKFKKFHEDIINNQEIYNKFLGKIELINGKVIEKEYVFNEDYYYNALMQEKINSDNVKSFKILGYSK